MEAKTLAALEASIAKWERNTVATLLADVAIGAQACPLCMMFNGFFIRGTPYAECFGCPVFERTGRHGCDGTPYDLADNAYDEWADGSDEAAGEFATAAASEAAFLKSLLPASLPEEPR